MPLVYLAAGRFLWFAVWELSWLRLALAATLAIGTAANWAVPLGLKFGTVSMGTIVLLAMLPALAVMVRPAARFWARSGAIALLALLVPVGILATSS